MRRNNDAAVMAAMMSVGPGMLIGEMARHATFRFCLDPTVEQHDVLARHAGASRFAFNVCLRMVKTALTQRKTDSETVVPWTRFDLINAFNGWKKTEAAGRVFEPHDAASPEGPAEPNSRSRLRLGQAFAGRTLSCSG